MKEQLIKFISENNLEFNEGSGGDINILALTGYAVFIGASLEECIEAADTDSTSTDTEIERVYNYAKKHNYGNWWKSTTAKEQYNF